ncbi:MAG: class I SAM-dependent methyltransferase [Flavobacteriales bacterium]|nr:class I SAM-dependent methyltransferase [Flavobacteriales bacterium]
MNAHQHYALLRRTPRALALRRIIQEVVKPGQMVLDAGCGSGLLSVWAAQAGAIVVGVDFADLALARALATENGVADRTTFLQGDLNAIGLEAHGPFDVLLAMVYLNDPRRDHAASALVHELGRYLRPGAVRVSRPGAVHRTSTGLPLAAFRRAHERSGPRCEGTGDRFRHAHGQLPHGHGASSTERSFPFAR